MQSKPQRPVKTKAKIGNKPLAVVLVLFAAFQITIISLLGCDSAVVDPPLPAEVVTTVSDTPDIPEVPSVEVSSKATDPVPQEKEVLLPFDSDTKSEEAKPVETTATQETPASVELNQEPVDSANAEPSMLDKAGDLFSKAKSQGAAAASGTGKWVQDKFGAAAETGEQTVDGTMKWANETFNSLKEKGLTTANDTSQWLSEDWSNMDCWEYHVVRFVDDDTASIAKDMNELGKAGWDCFHVDESGRYFFKKPANSYLRSLPFKDVIKLVPLMGAAAAGNK